MKHDFKKWLERMVNFAKQFTITVLIYLISTG